MQTTSKLELDLYISHSRKHISEVRADHNLVQKFESEPSSTLDILLFTWNRGQFFDSATAQQEESALTEFMTISRDDSRVKSSGLKFLQDGEQVNMTIELACTGSHSRRTCCSKSG
eukprot:764296-Hanusia_phi.AAC.1